MGPLPSRPVTWGAGKAGGLEAAFDPKPGTSIVPPMRFSPARSALLLLALATPVAAQERPLAWTGARIYPIAGEPIADGVLVVHQGKIVAVGAAGSVTVPAGAEVRALPPGKVILPGLVDSHSHIGGAQGGDGSGARSCAPNRFVSRCSTDKGSAATPALGGLVWSVIYYL